MTRNIVWHLIVAATLSAAIIMMAVTLFSRSARADGFNVPPPPPRGVYPVPVARPGSPSCLQTSIQMAYLTGRKEVGYANAEACAIFTGARGFQLPYGYYGPFVSPHWVPPGWVLPY